MAVQYLGLSFKTFHELVQASIMYLAFIAITLKTKYKSDQQMALVASEFLTVIGVYGEGKLI